MNTTKKRGMLLLVLLLPLLMAAQVSIQFTNTGYLLSKDQLWNLMLVNTGTPRNPVRVEISLLDVQNNQPLCKFTSKHFSLGTGPKLMNIQEALPVQTVNYSPGFTDPNPYGILPAGRYMMCVDVLYFDGELWHNFGNDCNEVEVVAFSPVILTLPEDMAVLENTNPVLTWLSPLPVSQFQQLQYDLLLVPVNHNQAPVDAIERNIPQLSAANIPVTAYTYLSSLPPLLPGKTYAWRVKAKNNGSVISVSETWVFSIKDTGNTITAIKPIMYTPLKRGDHHHFVTATGEIGYEYMHLQNDDSVTVQISDQSVAQPENRIKGSFRQKVQYGQNFLSVNTRETYNLQTGRLYKIILVNSRGEEWVMGFYLK
ncbi:MAG: hypothetical protein JNM68_15400 [Dinghuibacter sp.]|nr:hypothetical protein [Dinghuibacter sp.]